MQREIEKARSRLASLLPVVKGRRDTNVRQRGRSSHRSRQPPITASNGGRHRCVMAASLLIQRLAATCSGVDFCEAADHDDILIVYMTDNTCIDYRTISAHPIT